MSATRRAVLTLAALAGLIASPVVISVAINEWRRMVLASQLYSIELPEHARIVARGSKAGNFWNSDNCGYEAAMLVVAYMRDDGWRAFIEQVRAKSFPPPHPDGLTPSRPEVYEARPYATIVVQAGPYEPNLDPRCW